MSGPKTLFDKIWESHVVAENDDGTTLLYVDKHLIHEVTSWTGFERMAEDGRPVRRPDATLGVPDHSIPTRGRAAGVEGIGDPLGRSQVEALIANCERFGVPLIPLTDVRQGIVHIIGPEQGLTLPGRRSSAATATPQRMAPSAASPSASAPARSSMCSRPRR